MKCYVFDTSALLTLRDNEFGAEQVADLLYQAESLKIKGLVCFISLMEVLFRVWKDEGEQEARFAYGQKAAAIKATERLLLADAWIVRRLSWKAQPLFIRILSLVVYNSVDK